MSKLSSSEKDSNIEINAHISKLAASHSINTKAQENYAHGNYAECIRNLVVYLTSSLNALLNNGTANSEQQTNSSELNASIQKLTNLIDDSNILKLKSAVNTIFARIAPNLAQNQAQANILMLNNNDFFLSLLSSSQSFLTCIQDCTKSFTLNNSDALKYANILVIIYLNNLALAHYSLSKFNLSMLYFQKSLNHSGKYLLGDEQKEKE